MPRFDRFEIKMLEALQRDGRKPVSELAEEIGLSTTPCARRFEALQAAGVIKGFQAVIGRRAAEVLSPEQMAVFTENQANFRNMVTQGAKLNYRMLAPE